MTSTQTSMNPRCTPLPRPRHRKALGWLIPGAELTAHTGGRGPYSYTLFASSAWGVREGGVNHRGQLFQGTALEPRLQPLLQPQTHTHSHSKGMEGRTSGVGPQEGGVGARPRRAVLAS